jgi:hypothetical protein
MVGVGVVDGIGLRVTVEDMLGVMVGVIKLAIGDAGMLELGIIGVSLAQAARKLMKNARITILRLLIIAYSSIN